MTSPHHLIPHNRIFNLQLDQSESPTHQNHQSQSPTQKLQQKARSDCKNINDRTAIPVGKDRMTNHKVSYKTQGAEKANIQSGKTISASKIPESKKQGQGLADSADTSKKGAQGLVNSISRLVHGKSNSSVANSKNVKGKLKEEKTVTSRLPRKLLPGKDKNVKPKLDSKIPKPSK